MKKVSIILALVLLFISSCSYAGFFSGKFSYSNDFKYLEPARNLLYVSVLKAKNNKERDSSFISNIGIVNLSSNSTDYIFKKGFKEQIINLYFEIGVNSMGIVEFNENIARNNPGVKNRQVKDQLCICTYNKEKKTYSIWYCNKLGQNLKRVKSFNDETDWWIDVKNSKIYFINQVSDKIKVQSIEW